MKGKKSKKEEEIPQVCEVCRTTLWEGEDFELIKCQACSLVVHKNCYSPELKDKAKFKCDPCKRRKGGRTEGLKGNICSHCCKGEGALKDVGGQEWMHVLCALTSSRTSQQSYLALNFSVEGAPPARAINKTKKCAYCQLDRNEGLQCLIKGCKSFIHLTCVVDYAGVGSNSDSYGAIPTIGMLNQNEGTLLSQLANRKDFPGLCNTSVGKAGRKQPVYLVCDFHNSDGTFLWCPCGTSKDEREIECESCKRWIHENCLNDPWKKECNGCKDKDIFLKNLKLPELLG